MCEFVGNIAGRSNDEEHPELHEGAMTRSSRKVCFQYQSSRMSTTPAAVCKGAMKGTGLLCEQHTLRNGTFPTRKRTQSSARTVTQSLILLAWLMGARLKTRRIV